MQTTLLPASLFHAFNKLQCSTKWNNVERKGRKKRLVRGMHAREFCCYPTPHSSIMQAVSLRGGPWVTSKKRLRRRLYEESSFEKELILVLKEDCVTAKFILGFLNWNPDPQRSSLKPPLPFSNPFPKTENCKNMDTWIVVIQTWISVSQGIKPQIFHPFWSNCQKQSKPKR